MTPNQWMMNWKGCRRRQYWPSLRNLPAEAEDNHEQTNILTQDPPHMKQECSSLNHDIWYFCPGMADSISIIIKSFYSLWSIGYPWRASRHCDLQLFPWPHSMIFLFLILHPLLSFIIFSSAYLFFYIPKDSNLMLFYLLLLLLCVMCVQSNSIFFFLSDFLMASVGWFSIVRRL